VKPGYGSEGVGCFLVEAEAEEGSGSDGAEEMEGAEEIVGFEEDDKDGEEEEEVTEPIGFEYQLPK